MKRTFHDGSAGLETRVRRPLIRGTVGFAASRAAPLLVIALLLLGCSMPAKLNRVIRGSIKLDVGHLTPCQKETLLNSYLPEKMQGIFRNKKCAQRERRAAVAKVASASFDASALIDGSDSVETSAYALAPREAARDDGKVIDLDRENMRASHFLKSIKVSAHVKYKVLIVPGYADEDQGKNVRLHQDAIARLEMAKRIMERLSIPVILLTGGNVHPKGTPFNEAMEMKKHLMSEYGMPEFRIAVEPYARHSTTNLRNCGRFMRAHGVREALIVTTGGQNFYFGFQATSTFRLRAEMSLGYPVGELKILEKNKTIFRPSEKVFIRGDDSLDP